MLEGDSEMKQPQIMKKPILHKIWLNLFITDIRCIIFMTQEARKWYFARFLDLLWPTWMAKWDNIRMKALVLKAGGQNSLSMYLDWAIALNY